MIRAEKIAEGIDPAAVLAELDAHEDLWMTYAAVQAKAGYQTIVLRGPITLADQAHNLEVHNFPDVQALPVLGEKLVELGTMIRGRELGRVILTRIQAGGHIPEHSDAGAYTDFFARFHWVITTNAKCYLGWPNGQHLGLVTVQMRAGELWWFDPREKHHIFNSGETARIHLVFDCVAPGYTGVLPRISGRK